MRIALYEPDIPQNTGTILRLCACLGIEADIIEPAGFPRHRPRLPPRRNGLPRCRRDHAASIVAKFRGLARQPGPSPRCCSPPLRPSPIWIIRYRADDILLFGRESAGVPETVHAAADARLTIPMRPGLRSLNVAVAAAMAVGEALRQTGGMAVWQGLVT